MPQNETNYEITLLNKDVAVFAQTMDAMMTVKSIEREQDDSWYISNPEAVIKEFKEQAEKMLAELIKDEESFQRNSEIQKRAIHVANYCMMLFGIAYCSSNNLVKLRKEKDRKSDPLVPR